MSKLSDMSDIELINAFNKEVNNPWWGSARATHLSNIREEFNMRGYDYSAIWDENGISYRNKVKLIDKKIVIE